MGGYDVMRDGCVVGRVMVGSRLRGNDVDVCGNDVDVCGNDVDVCGNDVMCVGVT